mgnify:CR=1 FL=1
MPRAIWKGAVSFGLVAIALTHQVMVAALVLLAVSLSVLLALRDRWLPGTV